MSTCQCGRDSHYASGQCIPCSVRDSDRWQRAHRQPLPPPDPCTVNIHHHNYADLKAKAVLAWEAWYHESTERTYERTRIRDQIRKEERRAQS